MSGELLLSLLIRATLILGVAWLLASATRRASAAVRHGIWVAALAALAVLPAATRWLPPLEVPVPAALRPISLPSAAPAAAAAGARSPATGSWQAVGSTSDGRGARPLAGERLLETSRAFTRSDWRIVLLYLWLAGVVARGLWLGTQLLRVRRVVANALPVSGARARMSARAAELLAVRTKVRLLESRRVSMPVTCGLWRPVVLLPTVSAGWDEDRVRVVLLHELAHIRRRDYFCSLLAEVLTAVYWPVPLVWVARASVQAEQELASDDLVLASGTPAVDYADHLLGIARSVRPGGGGLVAAVGMAREAGLKRRIRTILDDRTTRAPLASLPGVAGLVAVAFCTLPIATLAPTATAAATPSAAGRLIPLASPADTLKKPSAPAAASESVMPPPYLWAEAEQGTLTGSTEIGDDLDASEGQFVVLTTDAVGGASLRFALHPRTRLWARVRTSGDAAIAASFDGTPAIPGARVEVPGPGRDDVGWHWVSLPVAGEGRTPGSGVRSLRLTAIGAAVHVDRVLATTDEGYVPRSRGAHPAGFAPVYRWMEMTPGPLLEPVEIPIDVPTPGRYVLWGRVMGESGGANSLFLSVDGGAPVVWDTPDERIDGQERRWVWDPASARELAGRAADPLVLQLEAGRHRIRLAPRESGTGLAGLLLTNDLSFRPRGRTPGSPPVQLWLEAENASPAEALAVRRGRGAGGDGYLEASDSGAGRSDPGDRPPAELRFDLPSAGVYTLWGRTVARRDSEDSFWIRVNGGAWIRWNGIPRGRDWQWSPVHDGDGPDAAPLQIALAAGENRIEIARREGGARLDRLLVTNEEGIAPLILAAE